MENKEYGVKLILNLDEFKTKMDEAISITKDFSQKIKENVDIEPELNTKSFTNIENSMSNLKNSLGNQLKDMFSNIDKGKLLALVAIGVAIKKIGDRFKEARTRADKFKQTLATINTNIKNLGKTITSKLVQSTNKGITSLKKYALHLFGLQALWRSASKAINSYMSYDSQLSKNIKNTWAGLGSFFAPILEYLVTAFQKLLSYANAVMQVFTGINFVARANAKAMKNVAGSTSNANKQLANFDEITNLDKNAGGGAEDSSTSKIELPEVDTTNLEKFANHLKELFNKGEYFQIGYEIGNKLTEALDKIPWDKIKEKASELGKSLAEFLNGIIEGIDWTVIGNTIAQGINTLIDFAYNFVTTFDWKKFGESIGTSIRTAIKNIEWDKVGKIFTDTLAGIFNFGSGVLQNLNGIEIANAIEEALRNIDWGKLASSWYEMVGSFSGTMALTIGTLIVDALDGAKQYFDDKIKEAGGNVVLGILNGIVDGLANIGIWIADNVFTPFLDGFKKAFKINSPSKVMEEQGGFIVDGLINAIKAIPQKALTEFNRFKTTVITTMTEIKNKASTKAIEIVNGIKDKFTKIPNWFKTKFTEAWTNVKNVFSSGGKIFDGIKEGIDRTFKDVVNRLIDGINKIVTKPFNKINSMLNDIRNVDILGVKPFQGLWSENPLNVPKIPKLKVGTDEVYKEGLAYLHAGEKVVPADVAKNGYTSNNEKTDYLLEVLVNKIDDLAKKPNIINVNGKELARATYSDFKAEGNRLGSSNVAIRRS